MTDCRKGLTAVIPQKTLERLPKMNMNIRICALVLVLFAENLPVHAQVAAHDDGKILSDFTFWRTMAGWWESDNTYFDSNMNYQVRYYSSLVHIELDGRVFRETEHRFYPAGLSTTRYGQGLMKPGEGVELIVNTTAELMDHEGSLGNIVIDHAGSSRGPNAVYRMLGDNDGVRLNTNPKTGVDNYRMYFNFTTPDRRFRSNFGLLGDDEQNLGGLRAFILYRDHRIDQSDFETRRAALREKHNVKVISVADPDPTRRSLVARLD